MNLILVQPCELTTINSTDDRKTIVISAKDARAKHIVKHLRKRSGDTVSVGIEGGSKYSATVTLLPDESVRLTLDSDEQKDNSQAEIPRVTLLLAMPFPMRIKYLWPVVSSMGVSRIIIVQGRLTNPDFLNTRALKPDNYLPLLREGLSQGGHTHLPRVDIDVDMPVTVESLDKLLAGEPETIKLFLDCGDENIVPPTVRQIIVKQFAELKPDKPVKSAVLAIGPERGWTEAEAALFAKAGFHSASLGPSILRVDTAVVSAISLAQATLQDCCYKSSSDDDDATVDNSNNKRPHEELSK